MCRPLFLPGFGTTYYTRPFAYRQVYINYYKDPNFLAALWDQTLGLAATQPLAAAQVSAPLPPAAWHPTSITRHACKTRQSFWQPARACVVAIEYIAGLIALPTVHGRVKL